MELVLKDAQSARASVDSLLSHTQEIDSVRESVDYILGELNEYWEENPDQHAFSDELKKSNEHLTEIISINKEFGVAVNTFVDATVATSSQTV